MGIFSSKKKIYVASTVYNMVDDGPRATFMQEALASTILTGDPDRGLGQAVFDAHLSGPRGRQRAFFRWAKSNYDFAMPRAVIDYNYVIDPAVVATEIHTDLFSSDPNDVVEVNSAHIDNMDESYYAEQHIMANRPELFGLEWAADYNGTSIDIQYPPGTEYPTGTLFEYENIAAPAGYNSSKNILVAYYTRTDNSGTDPVTDNTQSYIYEMGDGKAVFDNLRAQISDGSGAREFYPFIPLRIDNVSVFASNSPAKSQEDDIRDAYEKGLGGDIDELLSEIESNPDIGDIDYAYVVFGVPLNTDTKFGKKYVYEFMKTLADLQQTTSGDYASYQTTNNNNGYHPNYNPNSETTELNTDAYVEVDGSIGGTSTATQTQAPQVTDIHLTLPNAQAGNLDMKISWVDIQETIHDGVMKQGALRNEVMVFLGNEYQETVELNTFVRFNITNNVQKVTIRKQISQTQYSEIECTGLLHKNLIYSGKSVDIKGHEALQDEDESGFILPLHEPTLKRMGIVNSTEVAKDSFLIVFNSYQVVKKKWYQRGIFGVFIIVITVAIIVGLSFVTGGASLAALPGAVGILGTAAGIGAALGVGGILGIIIGATVNIIAAMIITKLITAVATELLGEKIGAIIGAIISVATSIAMGGFNPTSMSSWANMGSIDKIMAMTNAASTVSSAIFESNIDDINTRLEEAGDEHRDELDRLQEEWEKFGFGDRVIDPIMLTDFDKVFGGQMGSDFMITPGLFEEPDDFINRTLMTSDEMIDIANSFIDDFTKVTLTLS